MEHQQLKLTMHTYLKHLRRRKVHMTRDTWIVRLASRRHHRVSHQLADPMRRMGSCDTRPVQSYRGYYSLQHRVRQFGRTVVVPTCLLRQDGRTVATVRRLRFSLAL